MEQTLLDGSVINIVSKHVFAGTMFTCGWQNTLPKLDGLRNFIVYATSDPYIVNSRSNRPFWEIFTRKSDPRYFGDIIENQFTSLYYTPSWFYYPINDKTFYDYKRKNSRAEFLRYCQDILAISEQINAYITEYVSIINPFIYEMYAVFNKDMLSNKCDASRNWLSEKHGPACELCTTSVRDFHKLLDPDKDSPLFTAYTNLKMYLENLAADNSEAGRRTAEMLSAKYYC
jgi:hypothetical protein